MEREKETDLQQKAVKRQTARQAQFVRVSYTRAGTARIKEI